MSVQRNKGCCCCWRVLVGLFYLIVLFVRDRWSFFFFINKITALVPVQESSVLGDLAYWGSFFVGFENCVFLIFSLCYLASSLTVPLKFLLRWESLKASRIYKIYFCIYVTGITLYYLVVFGFAIPFPSPEDLAYDRAVVDVKQCLLNSTCAYVEPEIKHNFTYYSAFAVLNSACSEKQWRNVKTMKSATCPRPNIGFCTMLTISPYTILKNLQQTLLMARTKEEISTLKNMPSLSHYHWSMLKGLETEEIQELKAFFFEYDSESVEESWWYSKKSDFTLIYEWISKKRQKKLTREEIEDVKNKVAKMSTPVLGGEQKPLLSEEGGEDVEKEEEEEVDVSVGEEEEEEEREGEKKKGFKGFISQVMDFYKFPLRNKFWGFVFLLKLIIFDERDALTVLLIFLSFSSFFTIPVYFCLFVEGFVIGVIFIARCWKHLDSSIKILIRYELMKQNRIYKFLRCYHLFFWIGYCLLAFFVENYVLSYNNTFAKETNLNRIPQNCTLLHRSHVGGLANRWFEVGTSLTSIAFYAYYMTTMYMQYQGTATVGIFAVIEFMSSKFTYDSPSCLRYSSQINDPKNSIVNMPKPKFDALKLIMNDPDKLLQNLLTTLFFVKNSADAALFANFPSLSHFDWGPVQRFSDSEILYLREFFFNFELDEKKRYDYFRECMYDNDPCCCGGCCVLLKLSKSLLNK